MTCHYLLKQNVYMLCSIISPFIFFFIFFFISPFKTPKLCKYVCTIIYMYIVHYSENFMQTCVHQYGLVANYDTKPNDVVQLFK